MMFQTFLSSYRKHAGRQSTFLTASSSLAWTHNLVAEARLGLEGQCRADAGDEELQQLDTPPGKKFKARSHRGGTAGYSRMCIRRQTKPTMPASRMGLVIRERTWISHRFCQACNMSGRCKRSRRLARE